jgi:hypothetical protein
MQAAHDQNDPMSEESDEEKFERKEEEEKSSSSKVTFTGALPEKFQLLICNGDVSQSLAKIVFAERWTEIGKGETTKKEKTETSIEIYSLEGPEGTRVVVIPGDAFSKSAVNSLTQGMFSQMQGKINSIIVMDEMYGSTYPDQDSLDNKDGTVMPVKVHHTTHISSSRRSWMTTKVGGAAHFMCPLGGLAAACLM